VKVFSAKKTKIHPSKNRIGRWERTYLSRIKHTCQYIHFRCGPNNAINVCVLNAVAGNVYRCFC